MSLTVKHPFTSAIADDPTAAAAGQILPQAHWNANHTVTGSVDATQMPALTGDVTTVAGAVATTLATVNSNTGTFGDSTHVTQVTVNAKGLVTAASSVAIAVSATPGGSNTQVQFNDAGAFAGSGATWDKTNKVLTVDATGIGSGNPVVTLQNSGLATNCGVSFNPNNGYSFFKSVQGNSGGGLGFRDYNSQQLFAIDGQFLSHNWNIAGTWSSIAGWTVGTLVPGTDNLNDIGGVSNNVKTIYNYTTALKPVAMASLPGTPVQGMMASVTDGTAGLAWGATLTGGGANTTKYLVWYNNANWTVMGK